MATFADLELLDAVTSYGGAEVVRARRVLATGLADVSHLALFGSAATLRATRETSPRLVRAAEAASGAVHDQVARVLEVGVHDDVLYALAEPAEGVELASLIEGRRAAGRSLEPAIAAATALQLAQLAHELHERSDVWDDARGGAGLAALFPAGLRLDGVVVDAAGRVTLRTLVGAVGDPKKPTAFLPPELKTERPSAASDVFVVAQTLRALLTGDVHASSAPRLDPATSSLLGPLLAAGLRPGPDERLGLFMVIERLTAVFEELSGRTKPQAFLVSALSAELSSAWLAHVPRRAEPALAALRSRLPAVRAGLVVRWPKRTESNTVPEAAAIPKLARRTREATSEGIARVFTGEGIDMPFDDNSADRAATVETVALPRSAPVLDLAAASFDDEGATQSHRRSGLEPTAESDPPWLSGSDELKLVEARGAPPPLASEIEAGPTVEMKVAFDGTAPLDADADANADANDDDR